MQFYHDIITQKSFQYLQQLNKKYKFILIGGWAVFLHSKTLKSKDIDIIVDYGELSKMKEEMNVYKNDRLRKYEISEGIFDIDIYAPHYSELGVDINEIQKNTINKEGFFVPVPEILLLLKLYAWTSRQGSSKGQKDEMDIFSLALLPEFNWELYKKEVEKLNFLNYHNKFINLLKGAKNVDELGVNEQRMAKAKKEIIGKLEG